MTRMALQVLRRSYDTEEEKRRLQALKAQYHDEKGQDLLVVIILSGAEANVLTFPGDRFTVPGDAHYLNVNSFGKMEAI